MRSLSSCIPQFWNGSRLSKTVNSVKSGTQSAPSPRDTLCVAYRWWWANFCWMSKWITPMCSPLIQTDRSLCVKYLTCDSRQASFCGDTSSPKTYQWLKTTKVYCRSAGGSAACHIHSGALGDWEATLQDSGAAEADNEMGPLTLALKGSLPEVTCVRPAHTSLAEVSHLATTLTPKGVRKFNLT